ncbi:Ral GTPase-activating protein subunit alpha-2 [Entomortierella chlamydospora]|nr:Ral GTPase-activating protein subunit alpha-2 [Entomortierella chlamydospora]
MTHVLAHEVFQVDLEVQSARPAQTSTARHNRKMSDKYRHSRIHTSKAENSMRHSIGGELLSSQTNYSHQTYPLSNLTGERPSRRTNSVHYDPNKQPGTAINGPPVYTPSLLGHMVFTPNRDSARADHHSNLKTEIGETEDEDWNDHVGSHFSALTEGLDTNDDRLSRASSLSFHGPDSLHLDPIVERLSPMYGKFSSTEFVNISMRSRSPEYILSVWKNIVCSIGNPNDIQIPLVKTEAMLCLLDIWDLLHQIRTSQSINATFIPPLYDFAPWFFEAAKSNSDGGVGLPAIYGGLCRMMSRRYDQDFDPEFYKMFYASVAQGLTIDDSMIGHSIISNSSRLFTLSLPGSHTLVLPFLSAIRHMLLKDGNLRDGVNHHIRKQAIAILCSVSMLFYDFGNQQSRRDGSSPADAAQDQDDEIDLLSHKQTFARLVLDLTMAEANVKPLGKFWDTHSMLIQLCGMLIVNEWSSSLATCDKESENELLLKVLDHLYWTETSIVQSAVEVITTLASMYQDHEDNGWIVLEKVLSHLLSAMQEHLKLFQSDGRRGCMIASFYRCLTEWLMVIPAKIFSETDLSKRVFDLIEVGLLCGPDSTGENERKRALQAARQQQQQQQYQQQQQFRTNKERGPSFQHTGKTIHQHHRVMISTGPMIDIEAEQQAVKEAAEATLIHLVHFMNDMPFLYGSDKALMTLGMDNGSGSMTETGGAYASKDNGLGSQRVFALNDSILVTLEETPASGPMGPYHRVRVIIRDETGRYAWDSEIFYSEMLQMEEGGRPRSMQRAGSRLSERLGSNSRRRKKEMAGQLIWREGVKIRDDEDIDAPRASSAYSNTAFASDAQSNGPQSIDSLLWDGNGPRCEGDMLDQLLHYIGDQHPDCLFDGKTPLNQLNNGLTLSTDSRDNTRSFGNGYGSNNNGSGSSGSNNLNNDNGHKKRSTIDFELDRHLQEESYYSRISDPQARAWYDKLVELRSSLIQSDEDDEDYQGSNTLMSLVVNSNWEEDPLKALGDSNANGKDTDPHTEAYNRAKKYSGRRIRHENLQEIHAEAMRNANSSGVSPEMIPQRTSSLMEGSPDGDDGNVLGSGLLKEDATNMAKAFQLVLPPEPERPLDSYQHSRLLLSHLGLLCFDRFQEHNFVLLNHSPLLDRDLKNLDKKSGRETFKIAVLYVAEGQEGEQAILHNSKGSAAYNRFVHDLGWEVELADHAGYMGGLERNGSNGRSAIYYCSSTLEIIFHEVVRMPTDPDDPRQVKKKRHVGNDHVHIVWSEHSRAYDRNTIGGDFGNVIIVLTPVPDLQIEQDGQMTIRHHHHLKQQQQQQPYSQSTGGKGLSLVSVEVIRDIKLPVFGPLVDGMVVPMSQLGRLVRQTAIHANRLATAPPPLPPTPPSVSFTSTTSGAPMVLTAGPGASTGGGGITSMTSGAIASAGTGGIGGGGNRSSIYYAQGLPNLQFTSGAQGFQHLLSTSQAAIPGSTSSFASVGNGSGSGQCGIGGANSSTTTLPTAVAGAGGPFSTSGPTNTTATAVVTSAGTGTVVAGGPTASAHLTASVSSLVNVGSGPNASSASSLVSNSGSVNGGGSASSNTSGSGTVIGMTGPSSIGNFSNASSSSPGMSAVSTNGMASVIGISALTLSNMTGGPPASSSQYQQYQQQQPQQQQLQQQQLQQQLPQAQQVPNQVQSQTHSSSATVTTTATATASPAAFSSSMISMTHNAHPFKQRALAIEQITRRHKIEKWTFQQFMEQVFGYSTLPNQPQYHNHHHNTNYNAKNYGRD